MAQQATQDFTSILHWTANHFGHQQANDYSVTLRSAIKALGVDGPQTIGCQVCKELGADFWRLDVARQGRKGRHVIMLRAKFDARIIEVLRILHDSMDVARHIDI